MAEVTASIREAFHQQPQVLDVYLYGSFLRSDYILEDSDVDLLVVVVDDAAHSDLVSVAATARASVPTVDVTILRETEFNLAIHPSGSRHFFVSVASTGVHIYGRDGLDSVASQPLNFDETYRSAVQLCQRLRLVALNPAKEQEQVFWLNKCQHWIPCLLMELLHLSGTPERRLRDAHVAFSDRFPFNWTVVDYPYRDFGSVHSFMESLASWLSNSGEVFASSSGSLETVAEKKFGQREAVGTSENRKTLSQIPQSERWNEVR